MRGVPQQNPSQAVDPILLDTQESAMSEVIEFEGSDRQSVVASERRRRVQGDFSESGAGSIRVVGFGQFGGRVCDASLRDEDPSPVLSLPPPKIAPR